MSPTISRLTFFVTLLLILEASAQTCKTHTFSPPSLPSTCTYTYTSSGWVDSLGNPTTAPLSVSSSDSVCILDDNSDLIASSGFKGTLYVADGVTYSGIIASINGAVIHAAGTVNFPVNPSFQNAEVYIYENGSITIPGTFNPSGSSKVYNKGYFGIGDELQLGGSALFVSYYESKTLVNSDASIASEYANCGTLEVIGSLSSGGSSSLSNDCSIYIHTDMSLNSDYTNDGLFVLDGDLNFGTAKFYNNGTMLLNNISLANDDLIGNDTDSFLIVRNNATLSSGGNITGHMYYDVDDGGGFDAVCGSCTEDIDVLLDVTIPPTNELILEDCGANIVINPVLFESKLDFDGIDDYVSTPEFINGQTEITFMAWIKSDTGNTTDITIGGEDTGFKLSLKNGNRPALTVTTSGTPEETIGACSCSTINLDEWHHITGTYSGTTGIMKLYIDGELIDSHDFGVTGLSIQNTVSTNGNFELGRTSKAVANREYYKGDVDEVRVFNTVLTDSQIQQMVYQEIQNNSGKIGGAIIPKDIKDSATGNTLSWSSLLAYYPMTDIISYDRTTDYSYNDRITKLHNITSLQQQTAPMPYEAYNSGSWSSSSTWKHGNVWDIDDITSNSDYGIVKISNDVTVSHDVQHLGLIIDSGRTLTVQGDHVVENTLYLELNGTLDLFSDSQLVQTSKSDLVSSADGKVLRRQEGVSSAFWYNYWASPVGAQGVTSLTDNNGATNNTNNSAFKLDMLKDDSGFNCLFTPDYTASGNISSYWLYTFINGLTYWDWEQISTSTNLSPGVGYTQKGTGVPSTEQQYIFEGKPNNGTILINATDVGGPGSVANASKTEYLLGNPYPSALDIHKFIDDNAGVIDGTLQLWQQWSGESHNLNEYNGGYAQVNKTGAVRAYQFVGFYGANNGSQDGTKVPSRYLPVGQGFITEIVADGAVVFNNNQRLFIKEVDADGTYNNGSVFFKGGGNKSNTPSNIPNESEIVIKKIRLEFSSVVGPDTRRELLLGFSDFTSDAYDYGYDSESDDSNNNDLNLNLDGKNMNIQAYSPISDDKVVPLNFKSSGDNTFEIKVTEMENVENKQKIYLRDNLTDTYFDLTKDKPYAFSSEQGKFNKRFEIVFQNKVNTLAMEEANTNENFIYHDRDNNVLFAKKLNGEVIKFTLFSMSGQSVVEMGHISSETLNKGIQLPRVSIGAYIACFRTDADTVLAKKIMMN